MYSIPYSIHAATILNLNTSANRKQYISTGNHIVTSCAIIHYCIPLFLHVYMQLDYSAEYNKCVICTNSCID